jgi:hypothetical protein
MDIECEGWNRILEVFPDMDFDAELQEKPELAKYMRNAINAKSLGLEPALESPQAPKLDNDFSKYIILNGLPKCDEKKAGKLISLLIKLFAKRQFNIAEDSIEMNYDSEKITTGQCFIKLGSDEQAKISAALFNGYKLDSKHTFSACTFPDFDKIMAIEEGPKDKANDKTSFLEIKAHCLETIKNQYAF